MNRQILLLGFLAVFAIGPVYAEADFAEWDADEDGVINEAEYAWGFENDEILEKWDANEDEALDEDEFGEMFYTIFDADKDDRLTVAEFDRGVDSFFGEQAVNLSVPRWDANGDDIISRDEFSQTAGDGELFLTFDDNRDGVLESDEMEDGLFDAADRDADDELDDDEFLFDNWGF